MYQDIRRKAAYYAVFAGVLALLVAGAYRLTARFLADRQVALAPLSRPERIDKWKSEGLTRKNVSSRFPQPAPVPNPQVTNLAGEAAIQRQLKTLEEINRINEMNRQLTDQQRRMQNPH